MGGSRLRCCRVAEARIQEFLASARGALKDLQKAVKSHRAARKRQPSPHAKRPDVQKRSKTANDLFDVVADLRCVTSLASYSIDDASGRTDLASKFNPEVPCVIRSQGVLKSLLEAPGNATAFAEFKPDFLAYIKIAVSARAQKRILDDIVRQNVDRILCDLLPPEARAQVVEPLATEGLSEEEKDAARTLSASFFGLGQALETYSMERDGVATLRLSLEGIRFIVMTRMCPVVAFMKGKELPAAVTSNPLETSRTCQFFRAMTPELAEEYTPSAPMWAGTIGPGDVLFTPSSMLYAERSNSVVFGARASLVFAGGFDVQGAADVAKLRWQVEAVKGPGATRGMSLLTKAMQQVPQGQTSDKPPPSDGGNDKGLSAKESGKKDGAKAAGADAEKEEPGADEKKEKPGADEKKDGQQ